MEYLPCGDLLGFLRKSRGIVDQYYRGEGEVANLKTYDLVSFSNQIATGMVFLASRGVCDARTNFNLKIHLTIAQIAKYIGTWGLIKYTPALLLHASACTAMFQVCMKLDVRKNGKTSRKGNCHLGKRVIIGTCLCISEWVVFLLTEE